jgi:hypothetical protein
MLSKTLSELGISQAKPSACDPLQEFKLLTVENLTNGYILCYYE